MNISANFSHLTRLPQRVGQRFLASSLLSASERRPSLTSAPASAPTTKLNVASTSTLRSIEPMPSNNVILGVLGAGTIGKMHLDHIAHSVPGVEIKSICSRSLDASFIARCGLDPQVRVDYADEVLNDPDIDAVAIFTPSSTHQSLVQQAIDAGKHVFVEKPVSSASQTIEALHQEATSKGVQVMVGYNRRFDTDYQRLKSAVDEGVVGQLYTLNIINRDPVAPKLEFVSSNGNMLLDFTAHDFDMVRFLTGQEVDSIFTRGAALIQPELATLGDIDTAIHSLRLSDGSFVQIDNSRETRFGYDQRAELFGSKESVRMENRTPSNVVTTNGEGSRSDHPLWSYQDRYKEAYIEEMKAFVESIRETRPVPVTLADAAQAVKIVEASTRSLRSGLPESVHNTPK